MTAWMKRDMSLLEAHISWLPCRVTPKGKPSPIKPMSSQDQLINLQHIRDGFWLIDNLTFVKAESAELKQVKRKSFRLAPNAIETKPMLVLKNVAVLTIHEQKIVGVYFKGEYGVWLENIAGGKQP